MEVGGYCEQESKGPEHRGQGRKDGPWFPMEPGGP